MILASDVTAPVKVDLKLIIIACLSLCLHEISVSMAVQQCITVTVCFDGAASFPPLSVDRRQR